MESNLDALPRNIQNAIAYYSLYTRTSSFVSLSMSARSLGNEFGVSDDELTSLSTLITTGFSDPTDDGVSNAQTAIRTGVAGLQCGSEVKDVLVDIVEVIDEVCGTNSNEEL